MYWGLYLLPYQSTDNVMVPNIIIQDPSINHETKNEGIEINLTPQELLEAGYPTNKKSWSEEEDALLMKLFHEGDLSWKEIGQKMEGRTAKMCYSRYRRIESQNRKLWNIEEERKIMEAIKQYGYDWDKISQTIPKKTPKQVEDHYHNYLRPGINKEPWTYEEDLLLMQLLRKYGKSWQLIEGMLPGRTHNQIKNRYYGRLKRIEDKKLSTQNNNKIH